MSVIGLALSGGGARGIAHIGVLQALEDKGLNVEVISGVMSFSRRLVCFLQPGYVTC